MTTTPPVNANKLSWPLLPIRAAARGKTYKEESNSDMDDRSAKDSYSPSQNAVSTDESDEDAIPLGKRKWAYPVVSSDSETDEEPIQRGKRKKVPPSGASDKKAVTKRPRKALSSDTRTKSPPKFIKQETSFPVRRSLKTYQFKAMGHGLDLVAQTREVAILQDNDEFQFSTQLVPGTSYIFRSHVRSYNPESYRFSPWRDPNHLEHSLPEVGSTREPWLLSRDLRVENVKPVSGTAENLNVINKKDNKKTEKFIQARKKHYESLIDRSLAKPNTYTVKKIKKNSQLPHESGKEGGYGLFAKRDIRQGEYITSYTACKVIPDSPAEEKLRQKITDYAFDSTKRLVKWLDPDTKEWHEELYIGAHTGGAGHTANTAIKLSEGLNPQVDVDKSRCNASYEDFLVTFTRKSDPKARPIRMVDLTIVASKNIKKDEEILVEYPYEFIEWMNQTMQPKVKVKDEEPDPANMMDLSSAPGSQADFSNSDYMSPDDMDAVEGTASKGPWELISLSKAEKKGLNRHQRASRTRAKRESVALAYRQYYDPDGVNDYKLPADKKRLTGRPKQLAIQRARTDSAVRWFQRQDPSILDHPPPEKPPNAWTEIQLTKEEKAGLDTTEKTNKLRAKRLKIADDTMAGHDWKAYEDMLLRVDNLGLKFDAKQARINSELREWMEAQDPAILALPIPERPKKKLTALDVLKASKIPDGIRKDTYIGRSAVDRMAFHDDVEYQRVRQDGIRQGLKSGNLVSHMHKYARRWIDQQDPSILDVPIPAKPRTAWEVIPIPHEVLTSTYVNAKYEYKYKVARDKMDPSDFEHAYRKGQAKGLKGNKLEQYMDHEAMEWMKKKPASFIDEKASEISTT